MVGQNNSATTVWGGTECIVPFRAIAEELRRQGFVERPTPNKLLMILSSLLEPSLLRLYAPQKEVFWQLCTVPEKVTTPDMKCGSTHPDICFHFLSLQPITARGKYVWFLCLTQTVLHCMLAVAKRRSRNERKTPIALLVLQWSEEDVLPLPSPLSCVPDNVLRACCAATSWRKQRKHWPARLPTPSWYLRNACVFHFIGDYCWRMNRNRRNWVRPGFNSVSLTRVWPG